MHDALIDGNCLVHLCGARCPRNPPLSQTLTLPPTLSGLEKDAEGYMGLAEKWFVFAMVWSVMAAADEMGRVKLDSFLRDVEVSPRNRNLAGQFLLPS